MWTMSVSTKWTTIWSKEWFNPSDSKPQQSFEINSSMKRNLKYCRQCFITTLQANYLSIPYKKQTSAHFRLNIQHSSKAGQICLIRNYHKAFKYLVESIWKHLHATVEAIFVWQGLLKRGLAFGWCNLVCEILEGHWCFYASFYWVHTSFVPLLWKMYWKCPKGFLFFFITFHLNPFRIEMKFTYIGFL